jgi:Na+-driven multidrug efflux pump
VIVGLSFLVVGTWIPLLFLPKILDFFGTHDDLNTIITSIIWGTLPCTPLRIINENLKVFLQNNGLNNEVGLACMFTFLPFISLCHFFVITKKLGAKSIGIMLFYYESTNLIALWLLYICYVPYKRRKRISHLPVTDGLWDFYK